MYTLVCILFSAKISCYLNAAQCYPKLGTFLYTHAHARARAHTHTLCFSHALRVLLPGARAASNAWGDAYPHALLLCFTMLYYALLMLYYQAHAQRVMDGRRLPLCLTHALLRCHTPHELLHRFTHALLPGARAAWNGWATPPSLQLPA